MQNSATKNNSKWKKRNQHLKIGPDHLESIILKIIGKKIDNLSCHLQSIIPENNRFFAYYSGK